MGRKKTPVGQRQDIHGTGTRHPWGSKETFRRVRGFLCAWLSSVEKFMQSVTVKVLQSAVSELGMNIWIRSDLIRLFSLVTSARRPMEKQIHAAFVKVCT